MKESEDQWQDDLSKWKNRRRSVNSDIVKKKEEREKIEQITYSGGRSSSPTRESRANRNSVGARLKSLSSYLDDDEDVFQKPVITPRTRSLYTRSYTIDTPYYSSSFEPAAERSPREDEPRAASPATDRAASPRAASPATDRVASPPAASREVRNILDDPAGSDTTTAIAPTRENRGNSVGARLKSHSYLDDDKDVAPVIAPRTRFLPARSFASDPPPDSEPPARPLKEDEPAGDRAASPPASREVNILDSPAGGDDATASIAPTSPAAPQPARRIPQHAATVVSVVPKAPEPRRPLTEVEAPSSGSLYKRHLQLGPMEPKPPGVSRVSASLPRSYQRSDSARLTSVVTPRPFGTQPSRISSLNRVFPPQTLDDANKRVNGDANLPKKSSVPSRYHQYMTSEDEALSSSAHSSEDEKEEEDESEAAKSSVTSPAQSVSPVSPPSIKSESSVSPAPPAKETSQENHCEMRISLNQKPNSSRDFGFQAVWDSTGARVTSIQPGSQAEMCQLQAGDEVLTVNRHQVAEMSYTDWKSCMEEALQEGSLVMDVRRHGNNSTPETNMANSSLDFTSSRISAEAPPSKEARPVMDGASNGVNGAFREKPVTMRNKESETISLKNLKRRSEFFETGGSESAMPDIPVPSITPSSSRWSWDPEEERRRQEKWQKEQERLLQEKYKRDQEKLQEEWQKAQQELTKSEPEGLEELNSHSVGPRSPLSPLDRPATPPWREEERKRKEEQERQRQAEERRKREEEEERELRRLQEERKRKERQREEEEERKRREEEDEQRRQRRREEEKREEERRRQEAAEEQQRRERERERERERAFEQQQQQQQWTKSKSSPQLDEEEKPQRRVTGGGLGGEKKGQQSSSSGAEAERQQILNEMKKKTPLLTDSSWIRQRSSSTLNTSKEADVLHMRRGESLDNLDSSYNSWRSSWTPKSNSYVQNYARPNSALSGSASFYGGGSQRPVSATLPSSYSTGSLRGGAGTPSSPWSRQSPSPSPSSPSPTTSPEPTCEAGGPQQRSRSVSGKKICTFCDAALGKGAAMIIESLGLCYHLGCFKCIDCKSDLGGSQAGAEVRIRNRQLYCNSCYMRFKTGQPTAM